jgi:hypothetical protein
MRLGRDIALRVIGLLVSMAAVLTVGITAFVYTGKEHREAVKSIAREFFVLVEKSSRVRRGPVSGSSSPTPEGGIIQ